MAQCPDSCTHLEYTNNVFAHVPVCGIWAYIIYHITQVKSVLYWNITEWRKPEKTGRGGQWCEIKGEARDTC